MREVLPFVSDPGALLISNWLNENQPDTDTRAQPAPEKQGLTSHAESHVYTRSSAGCGETQQTVVNKQHAVNVSAATLKVREVICRTPLTQRCRYTCGTSAFDV